MWGTESALTARLDDIFVSHGFKSTGFPDTGEFAQPSVVNHLGECVMVKMTLGRRLTDWQIPRAIWLQMLSAAGGESVQMDLARYVTSVDGSNRRSLLVMIDDYEVPFVCDLGAPPAVLSGSLSKWNQS
jgi:hypothetical protein